MYIYNNGTSMHDIKIIRLRKKLICLEQQKPPDRKYHFVSVRHEACHKCPIKKQQQQKDNFFCLQCNGWVKSPGSPLVLSLTHCEEVNVGQTFIVF